MKNKMETIKDAYTNILDTLNKYRDICAYDISYFEQKANAHLFGVELKEFYGLDIDPKEMTNPIYQYFTIDKMIGLFGKKHNRTISGLSNKEQPDDEYLFAVSFPTGAYIFGEDYPVELFQQFFDELKLFKPDYIDVSNKALYWKLGNAKDAFNNYDSILKKYHDINEKDIKIRQIKKKKREVELLEVDIA